LAGSVLKSIICYWGLGPVNDIQVNGLFFAEHVGHQPGLKPILEEKPNIYIMTEKDKMSKYFIFILESFSTNKNIYRLTLFFYN